MAFIEVHATANGADIKTKKALKSLVSAGAGVNTLPGECWNPQALWFEAVSLFNKFSGGLDKLTEGTTLQVTGPNPWNKRNWYANIKIVNGKIKVS